jgi:hypothetical protein
VGKAMARHLIILKPLLTLGLDVPLKLRAFAEVIDSCCR